MSGELAGAQDTRALAERFAAMPDELPDELMSDQPLQQSPDRWGAAGPTCVGLPSPLSKALPGTTSNDRRVGVRSTPWLNTCVAVSRKFSSRAASTGKPWYLGLCCASWRTKRILTTVTVSPTT